MNKIGILIFSLATLFFTSCYYDNFKKINPVVESSNCDSTGVISYAKHIVPIINESCLTNSCHDATGNNGDDMTIWGPANNGGVNAYALSGKLLGSVNWDGSANQMPKGGSKISDCSIALIKKWVAAGALDN